MLTSTIAPNGRIARHGPSGDELFVTGLSTAKSREESRQHAFLAGLREITNYLGLAVPSGVPIDTERLYETTEADGSITTYRLLKIDLHGLKASSQPASRYQPHPAPQEPLAIRQESPRPVPDVVKEVAVVVKSVSAAPRRFRWPTDCPPSWQYWYCTPERLSEMTEAEYYMAMASAGRIPRNAKGEPMYLLPEGWQPCPRCEVEETQRVKETHVVKQVDSGACWVKTFSPIAARECIEWAKKFLAQGKMQQEKNRLESWGRYEQWRRDAGLPPSTRLW